MDAGTHEAVQEADGVGSAGDGGEDAGARGWKAGGVHKAGDGLRKIGGRGGSIVGLGGGVHWGILVPSRAPGWCGNNTSPARLPGSVWSVKW